MPAARTAAIAFAALVASGCAPLPGAPGKDEVVVTATAPGQQSAAPAGGASKPPAGSPPASVPPAAAPDKARTYPGTGVFVKSNPPPQPPPGPEEVSLNFEATEIRQVAATILGDILRESFTVHPQVQGTVSLRTVKPIPRKDLLPTLEMLLRQNNAALIREDALYKIVPTSVAGRGSVTPQLGTVGAPMRPGFSIVIAPVRFIGAKEMARLLEPFVVDQSVVRVDEVRNLLILQGTQRELRHLLETIDLFDVDFLAGMSVGLFPLQGADVKTLVAELDKIFGPQAAGPLAGIVRVVAVERLNALLVVTTQPHYLRMAETWIERLDKAGGAAGGTRLYVYSVVNGKAENLASLLSEIFTGKASSMPAAPSLAPGARPAQIQSPTLPGMSRPGTTATTAPAPAQATTSARTSFESDGSVVSKDVRVIADKDNNALLILASPPDYEKIEAAIKKLDVVPRQVLIEVLIAEVTLTDDLQYGIDWFINVRAGTSGTLNMGGLPATPTSPVPPLAIPPGGLQLINTVGGDVRAVLNAIGSDGRLKIVASPSLMVIDNQKAQIQVGRSVPTLSQQQSGTTGSVTGSVISSIQYLDTGIMLAVTPRVNSGGRITLEVAQEVSDADLTATSNIDSPTINKRTAQSMVTTQSGETVVFAGLIQTTRSFGTAGVPLLSKIPILGGLFGTQSFRDERKELILLITPKLIADVSHARDALDELRKKMPLLDAMYPPKAAGEATKAPR
jgi:general secretion pathway protein D